MATSLAWSLHLAFEGNQCQQVTGAVRRRLLVHQMCICVCTCMQLSGTNWTVQPLCTQTSEWRDYVHIWARNWACDRILLVIF